MAVTWLLTLRWAVIIVAVLVSFGVMAFNIVDAGAYWVKTGEKRPFIEATVGKMLSTDTEINRDAEWIKSNPDAEKDFIDMRKQRILTNVILMLFFWFVVYWLLHMAITAPLGELGKNIILKVIIGVLAISVIVGVNVIYTGYYLQQWDWPFQGLKNLGENFLEIWSSTGILEQLGTGLNETAQNTTQTINQTVV